jgi:hypothetical protein
MPITKKCVPYAGVTCGIKAGYPTPAVPTPPLPMPTPPPVPAPPGAPNIVFFLTDDQDQKLGGSFPMHGVTPMPKTQALMVENGATAENWFIHTPICCPSRSELVTGRYYHNLKKTGTGCMHIDEDKVGRLLID